MTWQARPIGEVFRVVNGGTPKTGVCEYWDGEHQWITPAEMSGLASPYLTSSRRTLTSAGLRAAEVVPENSIILSTRAPIGHLVINKVPMAFNQGCKGLVPGPGIDTKFAYYFLLAHVPLLETLGTGATFKELSGGKLKEVAIRFPGISEQKRIAAILDEAFAGIATAKANAEINLRNARAIFEGHLQSVFTQRGNGWVEQPLSELCEIKHGYAFEGEFFSKEGEYVLLTPGNFFENGGYRDRGEKQKFYIGDIPHDYVLKEGDLLVAMTEQAAGLLGSPVLVPESNRFLHNQRLGLVTRKSGVEWINEFFFHVFNTQAVRNAIQASASGVKVRHTSPTKIGDVIVAFPTSVPEQKRIVAIMNSLSSQTQRLESLCRRKLAALDALKQSLLHQAFSGQL